jgi:hypothetical protein
VRACDLGEPTGRLGIEVGEVVEVPTGEEVALDVAERILHLAFPLRRRSGQRDGANAYWPTSAANKAWKTTSGRWLSMTNLPHAVVEDLVPHAAASSKART